ncbi:MAG: MarR family transcriptional regulator [Candidatus Helarchaeota archaeon]
MPTLEIIEKSIKVTDAVIKKLEARGLLEITNEINPLLMKYNVYKLKVDRLVDEFISQVDETEYLLKSEGSLSEFKILKVIEKYGVVSPKLIDEELKITKPWINRLLKKMVEKGLVEKIKKGRGLYKINEKGKELIK